ncbi:MAG: marine proteobacterial sortase target protein [Trueperaceae bacterium]|nr:marine proteobacterial sortase target protein [Trueperaceae bacterium]
MSLPRPNPQEDKLRLETLLHVLITLLVVSGLLFIARAQEERVNLDDLRSGELLFYTDTPGSYLPATRVSSQVNMQITGMVARVTLSQQFQNTGEGWTEAIYVFPLPEDAAVDSLKMHIGERVIVGEIKREDEARAVYEEAKEAGQQTSLVEQERPNMFTTSVANIGPGETIIIEISYLETLRYDSGTFSLRFPLAITPRYIPGQPLIEESEKTYNPLATGWAANTDQVPDAQSITPPYLKSGVGNTVTIHAVIDAGFKLASLESRYHQTTMSEKEGIYSLELTGEVPADKDFELVWTPEVGAEPGAAVFAETWESESYALLMLMPPALSNTSLPAPAREVILIIDTSGSMEGTSIVQAKEAVQLALSRLKPADRFNVIEFNDAASSLFRTPREANAANLRLAERFVNQLRADGGTEMRSALELAFQTQAAEGYLGQVVFMTDGSVGNEAELFALIERELGSHRLFTVGIGSAPNSYFMRKAAEFGRGTYTFISDLGETGEKMSELFVKLEQPVLTGLELKLPAGSDVYPKTVPDLYLGEPVLVSVKLSAQGGEAVLSGNLNGEAWTRRLSLSNPGSQNGISQLWARAKIEELNDELIRGGNWEILEEDITQLALKHHLVTDYTSLIAVDKTPVRPANEVLETESIPQNLPAGQSYEAIFGEADAMAAPLAPAPAMMMKTNQAVGFADTATLAPLNLIIGLITLLLAFLLLVQVSRSRMRA